MEQPETILAVRRMQRYIEAHLKEPITMLQLAREAGYSPFHASRIFREHTGRAPFCYIRALRLTAAALQLRDGTDKVLDVALDFEFDSHEGFTRAFTREFGLPPKRYSLEPEPIRLFMPAPAMELPLPICQGGKSMPNKEKDRTVFVQVIERPARKALIKRGVAAEDYYAYCEEVGCDIWPKLVSVKEALYEPVGMWLPEGMIKPNTSKYVQGVELPLDYAGKVPEGYEIIELLPCSLMVFQGAPFDDDDFEDAISDIWDAMKRYDPAIYGFAWADDDGPRIQLAPMGYRGYIEARPVRKA